VGRPGPDGTGGNGLPHVRHESPVRLDHCLVTGLLYLFSNESLFTKPGQKGHGVRDADGQLPPVLQAMPQAVH